jgi:hypothetical protein
VSEPDVRRILGRQTVHAQGREQADDAPLDELGRVNDGLVLADFPLREGVQGRRSALCGPPSAAGASPRRIRQGPRARRRSRARAPYTSAPTRGASTDKSAYLQSQIGNPEGEDKPNKKYIDPRGWLHAGEKGMAARVLQAFKDLNSFEKF